VSEFSFSAKSFQEWYGGTCMKKNFEHPTLKTHNWCIHSAFDNIPVLCTRCGDEYMSGELVYGRRSKDDEYEFFCRNDNCYGRVDAGVYEKPYTMNKMFIGENAYIPFIGEATGESA